MQRLIAWGVACNEDRRSMPLCYGRGCGGIWVTLRVPFWT